MNPDNTLHENVTGAMRIKWEAPEYEHYEKTSDWYWWSGIVALVLLGIAFWQESFLFGVLIVVSWIAIVVNASRKPNIITLAVAERGLVVGHKLYFWRDLQSFWIFYEPPLRKELVLHSKKIAMPRIRIQVGDHNPALIREHLARFLPEVEEDDSLIDMVARLARF